MRTCGGKPHRSEFKELIESIAPTPENPVVILMDDAEWYADCDAGSQLKRIVSRGTELGIGLVLAGDEEDVAGGFTGWQVDAKKARRGILLSPQDTSSGDLVGIRTTRQMVGDPVTPGKGLMHHGAGDSMTVTVPV